MVLILEGISCVIICMVVYVLLVVFGLDFILIVVMFGEI